jgi:hypothetical protein
MDMVDCASVTKRGEPMTEQVPCHFPDCERPADPEAGGVLEVCREHAAAMEAAAEVEAWGLTLSILGPWVESTRAIGVDKLCDVMESALVEAEAAADLARIELERAETAAL